MWTQDVTAEELDNELRSVAPIPSPLPMPSLGKSAQVWDRAKAGLDCHEVYPDVFIGDAQTVRDKQYLTELRITHVVNCAEGRRPGQVPLNAWYFRDANIEYLGLPVEDLPSAKIEDYFSIASEFIDKALFNGGRVFVNCMCGISRASTTVMAFLMLRRGMPAVEAVRTVRQARDVWPNAGFLRKLAELNNSLRRQRCPQKSAFHPPEPYASIGAPLRRPC